MKIKNIQEIIKTLDDPLKYTETSHFDLKGLTTYCKKLQKQDPLNDLKYIAKCVNHVSKKDLSQRTRVIGIVVLRYMYYKIARERTTHSLLDISKAIGFKTHSNVLNGLRELKHHLKDKNHFNTYLDILDFIDSNPYMSLKENSGNIIERYVRVDNVITNTVNNTDFPLYLTQHLKEYSDVELLELFNTRLKPFKSLLNSRVKQKEIKNIFGAKLITKK
tara:strand:- start:13 stop:669 length:657 start_codon:yes stop_codon:yes gene_type:complete